VTCRVLVSTASWIPFAADGFAAAEIKTAGVSCGGLAGAGAEAGGLAVAAPAGTAAHF
jgi:hypothetical protein